MPNWCNNRLTIVGSPADTERLETAAHGFRQQYKPNEWDLERQKKALEAGHPDPLAPRHSAFCFHALVPLSSHLTSLPYDPHGYEAEHETWGVKWGDCGARLVAKEPGRLVYAFDTAWAPPKLFLEKLSARWPEVRFALSYGEEYPSRGRLLVHGGLTHLEVGDRGSDGPDYPTHPDECDDIESEEHECTHCARAAVWQRAMLDTHDEWAEAVTR